MSYTITINGVETATINGFENAVCRVKYTLTWTNEDASEVSEDFTLLTIDPNDAENYPDTSGFTAYSDVTEEQVKGWIEADAAFEGLCKSLSQRMAFSIPQNTSSPTLPWAS